MKKGSCDRYCCAQNVSRALLLSSAHRLGRRRNNTHGKKKIKLFQSYMQLKKFHICQRANKIFLDTHAAADTGLILTDLVSRHMSLLRPARNTWLTQALTEPNPSVFHSSLGLRYASNSSANGSAAPAASSTHSRGSQRLESLPNLKFAKFHERKTAERSLQLRRMPYDKERFEQYDKDKSQIAHDRHHLATLLRERNELKKQLESLLASRSRSQKGKGAAKPQEGTRDDLSSSDATAETNGHTDSNTQSTSAKPDSSNLCRER